MDKAALNETRGKFKETWHRLDSLFNIHAKSHGTNFTTMIVLELLCDENVTYTQKDICEKLVMPKQYINTVITSFWEQGFVELQEARDRRNKNIFLTDKGREYAEKILKSLDDAEGRVWECFTDEEIVALVSAMEKYVKSFEKVLEDERRERA